MLHRQALLCACAAALAAGANYGHASCGSAFCSVNTNWEMPGIATSQGLRLDLRYEFIDQDQPMAGSSKVSVGQIRHHHDEVRTINRNFVGTLDYSFNERWGIAATLPVSSRSHTHIHNHMGAQLLEQWDFTRAGDARVLGRYQLRFENTERASLGFYGINAGLKLPTGTTQVRNAANDRAERSLQPGTGTTDVLLGAYYQQVLPEIDSSWFVQALWQAPLNNREDYKPGQRTTLDVGYRYEASESVGLMFQLNALYKRRDAGGQAEPADSGGRFLFASPGISYRVAPGMQVYGFVQKAIYQNVNGVQLTADWSALVGLTTRF
jgi:hypothetical protein